MGSIKNVTHAEFESEVLKSDIPVLVDFWAVWCGPCKAIGKHAEELAPEYQGRMKVLKLDVDTSPQIAMDYGIRGVPTLLIFKGGQVVGQRTGGMTLPKLRAFIDECL